jgi:hypothetical protein
LLRLLLLAAGLSLALRIASPLVLLMRGLGLLLLVGLLLRLPLVLGVMLLVRVRLEPRPLIGMGRVLNHFQPVHVQSLLFQGSLQRLDLSLQRLRRMLMLRRKPRHYPAVFHAHPHVDRPQGFGLQPDAHLASPLMQFQGRLPHDLARHFRVLDLLLGLGKLGLC